MAKTADVGFWQSPTQFGLYKRNQGRLTRQLTAIAIGLVVLIGLWRLSQFLLSYGYERPVSLGVPAALSVVFLWMIYRAVNWPKFADFLIAVEAEMDKVTWPTRNELQRATTVVIATMLFIGLVLLAYDVFWAWFFTLVGLLERAV